MKRNLMLLVTVTGAASALTFATAGASPAVPELGSGSVCPVNATATTPDDSGSNEATTTVAPTTTTVAPAPDVGDETPPPSTTIPAELELDVPTTVAPAPAPELELDVPTTVASLRGPQVGRSRVPAIDAVKDTYEIDFVITYDVAGDWTWAYTQGGNFCKVKEMKVGETFMIVNGNVVGLFDPNRFRVQIVDLKGRSCKATVSIDSGVPINARLDRVSGQSQRVRVHLPVQSRDGGDIHGQPRREVHVAHEHAGWNRSPGAIAFPGRA